MTEHGTSSSWRPAQRALDILVALAVLVFAWIPMLILAILVRRDGGPALYCGTRSAKGGGTFQMMKFRSMVVNADKIGPSSTSGEDPRVTRIGRTMRRFKLDELPNLLNVLRGDMSIVGPRPEVPFFTDQFSEEETVILSVRPGMTDYASLRFNDEGAIIEASGIPDADEAYAQIIRPAKLRYQIRYAKEANVLTDLQIILATALTLVSTRLGGGTVLVPPLRPADWGKTRPPGPCIRLLKPGEYPARTEGDHGL